jgi:phage terminase large subunit
MPNDDALIAELTAPTYSSTSTGKMVVESKADMKKRGMRSPDLADADLQRWPPLLFGGPTIWS